MDNNLINEIVSRVISEIDGGGIATSITLKQAKHLISMVEKNYGNKQICLPAGQVVRIEKGEVLL